MAKKVAILVSGSGTNAQNLIEKMRSGDIDADPVLMISNRAGVPALDRAHALGVESVVIESKGKTREEFEEELMRIIDDGKIDLVILAGFMRILTSGFVKKYRGRLINIHPSLLPAFPGAHGIRDAFEAKVKETGVTVHYVEEGVDAGQIILQTKVPILPEDSLERLEERVHSVEYEIYPAALKMVLDGRVALKDA